MILLQIFTGHSSGSDVLWWVIVSFLASWFCCSKLMETVLARCSFGSVWGNSHFSLSNWVFFSDNTFIFLVSKTFRYSQE